MNVNKLVICTSFLALIITLKLHIQTPPLARVYATNASLICFNIYVFYLLSLYPHGMRFGCFCSSSLLEEDPTKGSTEPQDNTILGNNANVFEGEMENSQYVGRHGQSIGSSKYLKTHAFSPSTDWANGEVSTTSGMPKVRSTF